MKKLSIALFSVLLVGLCSCEKIIQPDFKNATQQLVIEGIITDQSIPCEVRVSKSMNFTEASQFNGVDGALVTLSDDAGNSELLITVAPGVYHAVSSTGIPGRTYYLNVQYDGKTYTSACKMPQSVKLDTVIQKTQVANGNTRRFLIPVYRDPAGTLNFYRLKVYANNKVIDKSFNRSDKLVDGSLVKQPIGPFFSDLVPGDTARVELMAVDEPVNDYFNGLAQALDGNSAAPANPKSNITGGCLGYFSAQSVRTATTVILE